MKRMFWMLVVAMIVIGMGGFLMSSQASDSVYFPDGTRMQSSRIFNGECEAYVGACKGPGDYYIGTFVRIDPAPISDKSMGWYEIYIYTSGRLKGKIHYRHMFPDGAMGEASYDNGVTWGVYNYGQ